MDWELEIEAILNRLADRVEADERTARLGYSQSVEMKEGGEAGVVRMVFIPKSNAHFRGKTTKSRALV